MAVEPLYHAIGLDELETLPDPEWIVEHWLMRQTVTVLTGPSQSFKTFIAMDLGMKLLDESFPRFGPHWIDHGSGPYRVLYVIGESIGAAKFRFRAWKLYHEKDDYPEGMRVHPDKVNLFKNSNDVMELIEAEDPDVVIFDTWSRNNYGMDENNKKDVDMPLNALHDIKMGGSRGGRSVVVIHHPSKAGSPFRGHTALLNDTDILFEVERYQGGDERVAPFWTLVDNARQKEIDEHRKYWMKLDTQVIFDEGGEVMLRKSGTPISSLVVTSYQEWEAGKGPDGSEEGVSGRLAELAQWRDANPTGTKMEAQAAIWPDKPDGKNVYTLWKKLDALRKDTLDPEPEADAELEAL